MKMAYKRIDNDNDDDDNMSATDYLNVTWSELFYSIITAGRLNPLYSLNCPQYSIYEGMYKVFLLRAMLDVDDNDNIVQSNTYANLEPTEKGMASFYLGMMITALLTRRLLNFQFVTHLHFLEQIGVSIPRRTQYKPDFIAYDALLNQYAVLESKGRSNGMCNEALGKGKAQTQSILDINGVVPTFRYVCMTYFSERKLSTIFQDPKGADKKAFSIEFDRNYFFKMYYKSFFDFLKKTDSLYTKYISNEKYSIGIFEKLGIEIGLPYKIVEDYYLENLNSVVQLLLLKKRNCALRQVSSDYYIGPDFTYVSLKK